ncbi:MAG: hypothetical protein DME54_03695 [Verrucomicrobia bacterium]|nr:MAG: hypothetical protein DME75_11600 [Verrucomicrobiota bacterium]PYK35798.1 MAG: hypothetical protein DME54_03695 [Verrucomicrobiota bacterium]
MRPDVLPLFIHLDSQAWKITKVGVHIICERFARFANDAENRVFACLEHPRDRVNRRAFAERRQN